MTTLKPLLNHSNLLLIPWLRFQNHLVPRSPFGESYMSRSRLLRSLLQTVKVANETSSDTLHNKSIRSWHTVYMYIYGRTLINTFFSVYVYIDMIYSHKHLIHSSTRTCWISTLSMGIHVMLQTFHGLCSLRFTHVCVQWKGSKTKICDMWYVIWYSLAFIGESYVSTPKSMRFQAVYGTKHRVLRLYT